MKEKILLFDIDDLHPEKGFGKEKYFSSVQFIKKLKDTFGLKCTFFVPLNWHNQYDISKDKSWIKWLRKLEDDGHEIAAHGLNHYTGRKELEDREFLMYDEKKTNEVLKEIKYRWANMGFDIKGIRFPGWEETKFTEKYSWKYFKYIASHIIGEKSIIGFNKTYKTPYNLSIENLYDIGQDTFFLHSHIGILKQTKNNLNLQTYLNIVNFISELEKKYTLKYMTQGEYVNWLKQKKN